LDAAPQCLMRLEQASSRQNQPQDRTV